jgi:flagellum-specific ATP synthase
VRGFLDGHIVLSRKLANANHFPAVDVLRSVSRLDRAVCSESEIEIISDARDLLSVYKQNEDLINVGAYVKKSNPKIDRAIDKIERVEAFLKQRYDIVCPRASSFQQLSDIFKT